MNTPSESFKLLSASAQVEIHRQIGVCRDIQMGIQRDRQIDGERDVLAKEGEEEEEAYAPISGTRMYVVAATAILGAGLLYMPASIAEGGAVFAVIGILLCMISSFYISKSTYVYLNREGVTGRKKSIEYADLLPEKDILVKKILRVAIVLQSALSIIVYLKLIDMWSKDIIYGVGDRLGISSGFTAGIEVLALVIGVSLALYLSTASPGKGSTFITILSAVSSFVLMGIVIGMFITIKGSGIEQIAEGEKVLPVSLFSYLLGNSGEVLGFLGGMAGAIFAINSQNYIPVYLEKFKSKRRSTYIRVPLIAAVVMGCVFLVVGVFGKSVLSITGNTEVFKENALSGLSILINYLEKIHGKESVAVDIFFWLVIGLKICMIFMLFSAFMWNSTAYRGILLSSSAAIRKRIGLNISSTQWVVIGGVFITFSTIFIVWLGIDTKLLVRIIGGLCASFILLFVPAWLIIRGQTEENRRRSAWDMAVACLFFLVFFCLFIFVISTSAAHISRSIQTMTN